MEYFAVFAPSAECSNAEEMVFEAKLDALRIFKQHKDARFKSFKSRNEALKFARNGTNPPVASILESILKSPPPNQPPIRSLEKSNFPAPKSQDLVKFRKEIEQNNVQKVYEMISTNPRYLVSSGDTPSILKEGPRYNALHVAAMNKHDKMAKLILQTVEQTQFIELLHGIKDDPNTEEMSSFLLESYLNTPDKSRNETPLHFASKIGALEVIEVLISYPLCKMKTNSEGLYPRDIICARAPDTPADVKKAIEELLKERFFVPVLRSHDSSVQPSIGEPFSPANMPKFNHDPMSPTMEIKAYAGPMTSDQATTFRKRWKTPPRLISAQIPGSLNTSFSPRNSNNMSSPLPNSPRMSKSLSEIMSSTPKLKKKLFVGAGDNEDNEDYSLDNLLSGDKNGNHKMLSSGVLSPHEEEYKELFEDLLQDQIELEKENLFNGYRVQPQIMETPVRVKQDSNSNHLNHNYNSDGRNFPSYNDSMLCNGRSSGNSGALATFLDESGSIYNGDNLFASPSFKEKHIRLTDISKGLESIGRDLANEHHVEWKEYWDFLGRFIDIRKDDGLCCFESFLKHRAKLNEAKEAEVSPTKNKMNESFGLSAICASLYSMDINEELAEKTNKITKNGLTSPSCSISRSNLFNDFSVPSQLNSSLAIPYTCIEQNCRTFAKRLAKLLEGETIQDQHSYEKMLLQEIKRLNTSIDNYMHDSRFNVLNFQKIHARYSFLLVWYLKKKNVSVKYLRNFTPLLSKVYALASEFAKPNAFDQNKDVAKVHAICMSNFISNYIEKQDKIFDPENVETETACVDAWNGPDIVECCCTYEVSNSAMRSRREPRKKLYSDSRSSSNTVDLWAARSASIYDDEDLFLSCSDESDSDEYLTPPQSPTKFDSDDDEMNVFEESLENFEEEKEYSLFIAGDSPSKVDYDVFNAFGDSFQIDEFRFPLVNKWFNYMKLKNFKVGHFSLKNSFHLKLSTPKLKLMHSQSD